MVKIDYRDGRIIRELHKHQMTFIKIKESKRKAANKKGVRQGCNLSFADDIANRAQDEIHLKTALESLVDSLKSN
jgi:type II secretory pathway component PulF